MSDTRIYLVIDREHSEQAERRLVRAKDRHKAQRWVVRQRFEVRVPTQDELVELIEAGTPIERAADLPEDDPDTDDFFLPDAEERRESRTQSPIQG